MKGFFIEVSNDLLDPKHCQQMGDAVWLFMWLLDKMTVIDHDLGEGKVLGGKPIKYEDVKDDLGISRSTYIRWLEILRKEPYIATLRTPYGQVITVLKAKKRFGRSVINDTSEKKARSSKTGTSDTPKVTHLSHENGTSNKTVSVDTTVDTNTTAPGGAEGSEPPKVTASSPLDAQIAELIFRFKEVNPAYKRLFAQKPQREAAARLLDLLGFDKSLAVAGFLQRSNAARYAPTITTPCQLEQKFGELKAWSDKQKAPAKTGKGMMSTTPV